MHTKEVSKNYLLLLLEYFPEGIGKDGWAELQYNEGVKYLRERYTKSDCYIMERSKLFWTWWKQTWEITDLKFLEACHVGCFDKKSQFTLEHYKIAQEDGSYFMPRELENLILKQPIHQSHETTTTKQESGASSTQQCYT